MLVRTVARAWACSACCLVVISGTWPEQARSSGLAGSFGSRGRTQLGISADNEAHLLGFALTTDGGFLATGDANEEGTTFSVLARFDRRGRAIRATGNYSNPLFAKDEFLDPGAVAEAPGGHILLAGTYYAPPPPGPYPPGYVDGHGPPQLGVIRFTAGHEIDTTYGSNGRALADFPNASAVTVTSLVKRADGGLIVGGRVKVGDHFKNALAAFGSDGRLDSGYGDGGVVMTQPPGTSDSQINALGLDAEGRVIAAGSAVLTGARQPIAAITRYRRDGSLDPSFGAGGGALTFSTPSRRCLLACDRSVPAIATGLALRPGPSGGQIVLSLGAPDPPYSLDPLRYTREQFALARLTGDGALDASFGRHGIVHTDIGSAAQANAVVVTPDDRLVIAGTGAEQFALARYSADGRLDRSFGGAGVECTSFGTGESATVLALGAQPDGRLTAAGEADFGYAGAQGAGAPNWLFARYEPRFTSPITCFDATPHPAHGKVVVSAVLSRAAALELRIRAYTPSGTTVARGTQWLGRRRAGLFRGSWNARLHGHRLKAGAYVLDLVSIDRHGRVLARAPEPREIAIARHGR